MRPFFIVLQLASMVVIGICFVIVARANGQLRKANAALREDSQLGVAYLAALMGVVQRLARTCDVCYGNIDPNGWTIVVDNDGRAQIGHHECFPVDE